MLQEVAPRSPRTVVHGLEVPQRLKSDVALFICQIESRHVALWFTIARVLFQTNGTRVRRFLKYLSLRCSEGDDHKPDWRDRSSPGGYKRLPSSAAGQATAAFGADRRVVHLEMVIEL